MRAERALPRVPSSFVTSILFSWPVRRAQTVVNNHANRVANMQKRALHIFTIIKRLSSRHFWAFCRSCGSKQPVKALSHI
jgi:hypothetical protein